MSGSTDCFVLIVSTQDVKSQTYILSLFEITGNLYAGKVLRKVYEFSV